VDGASQAPAELIGHHDGVVGEPAFVDADDDSEIEARG
jgi:hypothetical protein